MNQTQLESLKYISGFLPWWGYYCFFILGLLMGIILTRSPNPSEKFPGMFVLGVSVFALLIGPMLGYLP